MANVRQDLQIENATIMFRNFRGEPDKFNTQGKRTFVVFIDPADADRIASQGWNVKRLSPRDGDEIGQAYLNVEVQYRFYPPTVMLIVGNTMTKLDEETIGQLDWAEIEKVDLILRPYEWEMAGRTGVKAYLKKMWVTLKVSPLEQKYSHMANDLDLDVDFDTTIDGRPL